MNSQKLFNAYVMLSISFIGFFISNIYLYILQSSFNTTMINIVVEISAIIFYSLICLLLLGGFAETFIKHKELIKK